MRDARVLLAKVNRIDDGHRRGEDAQCLAFAIEIEPDVIWPLLAVAIGDDFHKAPRSDVAQRCEGGLPRRVGGEGHGVVGDDDAVEGDGGVARVEQLEPVGAVERGGHPFIEAQRGGGAEGGGGGIGAAGGGGGEQLPRRAAAAEREIRDLEAEGHGIDGHAGGVEEPDLFAIAAEGMAGVLIRAREGRRRQVRLKPHDEVTEAGDGAAGGEGPLAGVFRIGAEAVAGEVEARDVRVAQFDVVGGTSGGVGDDALVHCENFVEEWPAVIEQVVRGLGALAEAEGDGVGRAVGESALAHALRLRSKGDAVALHAGRIVEHDGFACGAEVEVEVLRAGIAIGEQLHVAAGREVGEGVELMQRIADADVDALQRDGRAEVFVVKLDPVVAAGHGVGQPFVDDEIGRGREGDGDVRGVGRGLGEGPRAGDAADGVIRRLDAEADGIDAIAGRVVEEDLLAIRPEAEGSAQSAQRGVGGVAPDDEVFAGGQRGGGEDELSRIAVVGEAPAGEVHRAGAAVVEFNPVRVEAVVRNAGNIVGHDFVQDHAAGRRRSADDAGRAVGDCARAPVRRIILVAEDIDDLQRRTEAIGGERPAVFVIVIDGPEQPPVPIVDAKLLAAVVELAAKTTEGGDAGITIGPTDGA